MIIVLIGTKIIFKERVYMKRILSLLLSAVLFALCLTACGDSSSQLEQEKAEKLKRANNQAKLVFTTLIQQASTMSADALAVHSFNTDGKVSVKSLADSDNPLAKEVYDKLKSSAEESYVFIKSHGDDVDFEVDFVQWSESEDGEIIGQYPDPIKNVSDKVEFGKKF